MKFLDQFIPEKLKEQQIVFRSTRMILNINYLAFVAAIFSIPLYMFLDFSPGVYIMMYTIVVSFLFGFVVYFSSTTKVFATFFCVNSLIILTALISQSGAMGSPFLIWLIAIPPITILSMPIKHGLFWSGMSSVIFIAILLLQVNSFPFPQHLTGEWHPIFQLGNYSLVSLLFVFVISNYLFYYRKVKRQLKGINKNLQESNSELDRFAAIASHDLKSPLRSIVSFGGLMEMKYGDILPEEGKEYLKIMTNNARQMNNLIEDILEYSKNNSYEQKKEKLNTSRMLVNLTSEIKLNAGYEHTEILCQDLPLLFADHTWMKQLFQNLIFNGLKYNENSIPTVEILYEEQEEGLHFQVKDNGIGIDPVHQGNIFEMFKRLHGKGVYEGTGIGLATCKKIMNSCNGKIWVTSSEGNGATFHLLFPREYLFEDSLVKPKKEVVLV